MKADKEHRVPLSNRVMEQLARRREHAPGPNMFTGYSDEALNDKALRFELYAMGYRNKVTVHGFRSAFRNWCAERKHDFAASECAWRTVSEPRSRGRICAPTCWTSGAPLWTNGRSIALDSTLVMQAMRAPA
jgi:hypothetical protein